MNDNLEKIKQLYIITEMTYIKNNSDKTEEEIFPIDWYRKMDYIKKIEILGEALKNNSLIVETSKYKEYMAVQRR